MIYHKVWIFSFTKHCDMCLFQLFVSKLWSVKKYSSWNFLVCFLFAGYFSLFVSIWIPFRNTSILKENISHVVYSIGIAFQTPLFIRIDLDSNHIRTLRQSIPELLVNSLLTLQSFDWNSPSDLINFSPVFSVHLSSEVYCLITTGITKTIKCKQLV